jgi:beta-lactamase regulating signal transducer with metallopeptidase domain
MTALRRQVRTPAPTASSRGAAVPAPRLATAASVRVSRISLLLSTWGLLSAIFVVTRALESWRVTPNAASHHVSLFGHDLTYPAANAAAIVVVVLAAAGLIVAATAVRGAVRELAADRRFSRRLAALNPRRLHEALVIDDERPRAFCAGLIRPRVYISTGAAALLDEAALQAVLAHEHHHARRHDPLRLATGRVLGRALFFVPGLPQLIEHQQALAELSADETAVLESPANRSGLAAAMLTLSDVDASGSSVGVDPARVDHLLGEPPSWRFPLAVCLAGVAAIALFVAIAVFVGRVAHGSATLAPPFLSDQPCVVVLAALPAGLGLLAVSCARRRRARP